jgi:CheY-like chemotaxis protein
MIEKKKILAVDDDFDQRDLYKTLFEKNDFAVTIADDGLQAYDKALEDPPDLIFTGVIMPKMDGFELIDHLRKHILTANVPVIMFSHLGREEDKLRAAKYDRVYFMLKGYDSPTKILEKVKELLLSDEQKLGLKFTE